MYVSGSSSTYNVSFFLQRKSGYLKPHLNEIQNNKHQETSKVQSNQENSPEKILSTEEKKKLEKLKKIDEEVKSHEQAHHAAAGSLAAGAPKYQYQTGPDGKQYAVSGHVDINTSRGTTPEETIQKAQMIRRAALAPKNPSAQDKEVAQAASKMEAEAKVEQSIKFQQGIKAYGINENKEILTPETDRKQNIQSLNNRFLDTVKNNNHVKHLTSENRDFNHSGQIQNTISKLEKFTLTQNYESLNFLA